MLIRTGKSFVPSLTAAALLAIMATGVIGAPSANGATTSWSAMSTPLMKPGTNQLQGISCAPGTVKFCAAVGSTAPQETSGPEGPSKTLAEVWNGKWKVTPTPDPAVDNNQLEYVSCASPTLCVAVGLSPEFLALWSGSAWSVLPNPVANPSFFARPACFGTDCLVLVGQGSALDNNLTESLELWNGQGWTDVTPSSLNLNSNDRLDDVNCFAAEQCLGLEESCSVQAGSCSYVGTWVLEGGTWTEDPPPSIPSNGGVDVNGVGCAANPAPATCMLFGGSEFGPAFSESWNDSSGTWTQTSAPITVSGFSGISCPATDECVAAGATGNHPIAELWNGSIWTQMKASGTTTDQGFTSVSCPLTTFCVATQNKPVFNDTQAVIDSWGTPPGGSSLLGGL